MAAPAKQPNIILFALNTPLDNRKQQQGDENEKASGLVNTLKIIERAIAAEHTDARRAQEGLKNSAQAVANAHQNQSKNPCTVSSAVNAFGLMPSRYKSSAETRQEESPSEVSTNIPTLR